MDERAVDSVLHLPFDQVVAELVEALGPATTAILCRVSETRIVRAWEAGAKPDRFVEARLRTALQATRLLVMSDDALLAKAWWFGMNPTFGGRSPAEELRDAIGAERLKRVVCAARGAARS